MIPPTPISRRTLIKNLAACSVPLALGNFSRGAQAENPPKGKGSQHVEVKPHLGRTSIFVDGQPISGMSYYGHGNQRIYNEIADIGVPIFFISAGPEWIGPQKYDFSSFEERVKRLGEKVKDIWLIPRLNTIATPHWWADAHPDEITRYADAPDRPPEIFPDYRNPRQGSMASKKWIADVGQMIRALVDSIEAGPYASRVLGYMLNTGGSEEWVYWGAQLGMIPDYSPPAMRYFKDWLGKKYPHADWIEKVELPLEPARRRGEPSLLRDPIKDRVSIEFELCLSDIVADCLLAWCAVVKDATGGKRLAGAFSSYLMWQTGLVNSATTNGHLGLRRLLESPAIDFITGITSYDNRGPGGPGSFILPVESIQRAGKYFFNESDIRTHLLKDHSNVRWTANGLICLHPLQDEAESIDVLRREFCHHLIHGAGWWNFDMTGGWFDSPAILGEFKKHAKITSDALHWDMTSVAEVACFVSGVAPAYQPLKRMHDVNNHPALLDLQCDRATRELYRSGLPMDWWMTEDLVRKTMDEYKVLFFYNATWVSAAQRLRIKELQQGGRVMIFVGYPGLATDDGIDVGAASELVGMKFQLDEHRVSGELTPKTYDDPAFREVKTKWVLGSGAVIGPRLIPDDPQATVLAYWPDGRPGAAVKRGKDYTAYYFPVSPNQPDLFRTICQNAGCFAYSGNNDILFMNRSLLAIHVVDCIQPIRLPKPRNVTNLFTGEVIGKNTTQFMPRGGGATHLYRLD